MWILYGKPKIIRFKLYLNFASFDVSNEIWMNLAFGKYSKFELKINFISFWFTKQNIVSEEIDLQIKNIGNGAKSKMNIFVNWV